MTRSELIDSLVSKLGNKIDPNRLEGAINEIIDYLGDTIATGNKIEIRGFGSFSIRSRAARTARNPRTGEQLNLACVHVPYFKPGKELKERINDYKG